MRPATQLRFLLFFGVVLFALVGCGSELKGKSLVGAAPPLTGDLLQEFTWEQTGTGHDSTVFTGHDKNTVLKVTLFNDMNAEQAADYGSSKLFVIKSLYREIHSPYPGPLSNRIECSEEFKPVVIEASPFDYHLLYATDRFTYGACSWDLITYKTILYFQHCETENSLYQIELFVPIEDSSSDYEESLKAMGCP